MMIVHASTQEDAHLCHSSCSSQCCEDPVTAPGTECSLTSKRDLLQNNYAIRPAIRLVEVKLKLERVGFRAMR